jgi:hypothetical protein
MSQEDNTQHPLNEESIYLVTSKDVDDQGRSLIEIAQYRKGKFWFFGWEVPEPVDKFSSWKELVLGIKEIKE